MAETKHAPGPWEQWNAYGRKMVTTIRAADRTKICTMADGTDEWVNAHARLIKAAPELLDALKGLGWSLHEDEPRCFCFDPQAPGAHTEPCQAARAAIAKAEGRP